MKRSTPESRAAVRDSAAWWTPVEAKIWQKLERPAIYIGTALVVLIGSVNDLPIHL